jgi:hypothetical protein
MIDRSGPQKKQNTRIMSMKPCALFRRQILALLAFALVICGAPAARATDTFNGTTLTIPVLSIGLYEYANVVVTAGLQDIVVRPSGTSPLGGADIYRSASKQLYIPAVTFGPNTYYNMTITPETLVSIGGLVYGDTFNGTDLFIPYVIVPGARLSNVILEVTTANILSIGGGLPTVDYDTYANGQLHIPAVQVGNNVYTNVILSVGPGNIVYPISGNVSGLAAGQQVTLVDSTGGTVTVSANRAFMLPIALHPGTQYDVTVQSQPNASFCTIANGSGTMTSAGAAVTVGCGVKTDSFPTVGSYTWTVPVGVTSIQAVVTGAGGGGNTLGSVGGSGAIVTANLSVTPGEVLNLVVGGGGGIGNSSPSAQGGAGGGGASSIGYGTPATGGQILIVAGAGGGAGDGGDSPSGFVGTGATGGDAGVGTNSSSTPQIFDGTAGTSYGSGASVGSGGFGGGAVGNAVAGGAGGASPPNYTSPVGYPGSAGFGGAGGTGGGGGPNGNAGYGAGGGTGGLSTSGGGGGGGAGGGGGGGKLPPVVGGGGGGGGTLVPAGGSAVLANNGSGVTGGAGSIVINY